MNYSEFSRVIPLIVLFFWAFILVSNYSILGEVWRNIEEYERMRITGYKPMEENNDKENYFYGLVLVIVCYMILGFVIGYFFN
jgi:hypothetical protein